MAGKEFLCGRITGFPPIKRSDISTFTSQVRWMTAEQTREKCVSFQSVKRMKLQTELDLIYLRYLCLDS